MFCESGERHCKETQRNWSETDFQINQRLKQNTYNNLEVILLLFCLKQICVNSL